MYIRKLSLKNIKGIDALEVEFKPGCCTIIFGENGAGKSSVLDALIYLEESSHNPYMIRNFGYGANQRGEIFVWIGDDGDFDGAVIQCTITPDKTTRILRHPRLGKIGVAERRSGCNLCSQWSAWIRLRSWTQSRRTS